MSETLNTSTNKSILTLSDFNYQLPTELVAHNPESQRDQSKLLVSQSNRTLTDHMFSELPNIIPENSLIVANNSKVFASRFIGQLPTGGKVEIFLLGKPYGSKSAVSEAIGKPMKKLKRGSKIHFSDSVTATVIEKNDSDFTPTIKVEFNLSSEELLIWSESKGYIPLPPYINRETLLPSEESNDKEKYQTVYANEIGSVAAPTAGLHFTTDLIKNLKSKNIDFTEVTLHVGAGTFMPVKSENIDEHIMHKEWNYIPIKTIEKIEHAKKNGYKIICVGTTSLRTLESIYRKAKTENKSLIEFANQWNETDLFLRPEDKNDIYKPWIIDGLITNFHQPCSTLFMLICKLVGYDNAHKHYQYAIKNKYRFFSYGDSNLFWL